MDGIKLIIFSLLPKNLLSQAFGYLARVEFRFFATPFKKVFIWLFKIDTSESELSLNKYKTVQDFFVRRLKAGARPIADTNIVSPVDGFLSQTGIFTDSNLKMIQAKGRTYSLKELLPDVDDDMLANFIGGAWATIYLAPYNYHRIHAPVSGSIIQAWYQPGNLWPVNQWSVNNIEKLFCVNERITTHINVESKKDLLLVKVGATNVGRISLSYTDKIISNTSLVSERLNWKPQNELFINKGDELGTFELGSTVIVICSKELYIENSDVFKSYVNQSVVMGQSLL